MILCTDKHFEFFRYGQDCNKGSLFVILNFDLIVFKPLMLVIDAFKPLSRR